MWGLGGMSSALFIRVFGQVIDVAGTVWHSGERQDRKDKQREHRFGTTGISRYRPLKIPLSSLDIALGASYAFA